VFIRVHPWLRVFWYFAVAVVVAAAVVAVVALGGTLGVPVVQDGAKDSDSIFRKALGGGDQRVARGPRVWDKETGKLVKEN
jgi:hypothetical protein